MDSIYRSARGRDLIRTWCRDRLAAWPVPHERTALTANGARTHLVLAGSGPTTVVYVPGTNFNAAASLPMATSLVTAGYRVAIPDVPGQPGLSTAERTLPDGTLSWYGTWLSETIEHLATAPVVVMGHSFGAAIALSADSPRIERLVLLSPGGLTKLRVPPALLAAAAAWFLRPTPKRSARLLRAMHAPGRRPREELVHWMTLVARHARSSADPGPAAPPPRSVPRLLLTGEHDVFLPPRRLAPVVRATLGTELRVMPDAGHLIVEEHTDHLAALVRTQA
ncbi:alpha/beta fold hydrolase [Streptomyces sp. GS7]|uniref:alpha/beta fold hydrolase n=1 Tax=Streptomyces sp. GS7 TaxID=2692234 RepID=UPI00131914FF|nr:alpha/beta hydrolase [Streptomyces sp. GS7]QHC23977.1 alpha/beta fold hydrolase [Streptomyces sp. GS7]